MNADCHTLGTKYRFKLLNKAAVFLRAFSFLQILETVSSPFLRELNTFKSPHVALMQWTCSPVLSLQVFISWSS